MDYGNIIKTKDSSAIHYTFLIAGLLFSISIAIAIYVEDGNNYLKRYNLYTLVKEENDIMILLYHNNCHFNLIYDINENVVSLDHPLNINDIKVDKNLCKNNIKTEGVQFLNTINETWARSLSKLIENLKIS